MAHEEVCCTIALVGQPNAGKSTFFNSIAGYKAISANFPGATVKYQESKVTILGKTARIVDLPGLYSLSSKDLAELEARKYLLSGKVDIIVNIVDASVLGRSLELTLELMELGIPLILALNMIDIAEARGEIIDAEELSSELGIPVYPIVAKKGKGVKDLIYSIPGCLHNKDKCIPAPPVYEKPLNEAIEAIAELIKDEDLPETYPLRFVAIKFLEEDAEITKMLYRFSHQKRDKIIEIKQSLEKEYEENSFDIINKARHGIALTIFERVVRFQKKKVPIDDKIDSVVMHPILGYVVLAAVFYGFFYIVFKGGEPIEDFFMGYLDKLSGLLQQSIGNTLGGAIAIGFVQGIGGALAIAIPYLLPFFIGLSFLEDTGYLPRVAFLTDAFMHRIGLHGKSVVPFILGYGCNVPAVLATRNLDSTRERIITAALSTMIPCSARTTVIMGLVGYFGGPLAAIGLYVLNILVIGVVGKILLIYYPEVTPGMVLEIPKYNLPSLKILWLKTWLRLKEFIYIAIPVMMLSSGILSILEYYKLAPLINDILAPFTAWLLGLPKQVGLTLIFGVFRKELTLIMLFQALGVKLSAIKSVMSFSQMLVFTTFVIFYVPCVATLAALWKEVGKKGTIFTVTLTLTVATIMALFVRAFTLLFPF